MIKDNELELHDVYVKSLHPPQVCSIMGNCEETNLIRSIAQILARRFSAAEERGVSAGVAETVGGALVPFAEAWASRRRVMGWEALTARRLAPRGGLRILAGRASPQYVAGGVQPSCQQCQV